MSYDSVRVITFQLHFSTTRSGTKHVKNLKIGDRRDLCLIIDVSTCLCRCSLTPRCRCLVTVSMTTCILAVSVVGEPTLAQID